MLGHDREAGLEPVVARESLLETHEEATDRLGAGVRLVQRHVGVRAVLSQEAQHLVNGLFGVPYKKEEVEAGYVNRPLRLHNARVIDGMYFYQGAVRTTRRVVNTQHKGYLDLHPGEEILLNLFDGSHTLAELNNLTKGLQALPEMAAMPVRNGTDLLVQLDGIGVLA